jgi:hypothetical protein
MRGERRTLVTPAIATFHAGGGGVLMAIGMILEMELAAQDSTQPFLSANHTTVGYEICVRHRRPTPVGEWSPARRNSSRSPAAGFTSAWKRTTRGADR